MKFLSRSDRTLAASSGAIVKEPSSQMSNKDKVSSAAPRVFAPGMRFIRIPNCSDRVKSIFSIPEPVAGVVGNNWFSVALDNNFTKPFFFDRSVVVPGMAGKGEKCHQGLIRRRVDAAVGVAPRNYMAEPGASSLASQSPSGFSIII